MTDSLAQAIACIDYGSTFPLTYRLGCAPCQGLLQLRCDLAARRPGPTLLTGRDSGAMPRSCPFPIRPIASPSAREKRRMSTVPRLSVE